MEFKNTLYEKSEGVATITINRPKALNALNDVTVKEILARIDDAKEDHNVRVVVITGVGEKAFSAGADLNVMKGITPVNGEKLSRIGQKLTTEIEALGKPVIAAVNGFALGGGLELAMSCDIRIASENAKLGQPEVNVGLIPGWGGTQRLPRYVGKAVAKEMIFTGKMISAQEAEKSGLVNKVTSREDLMSTVTEMAAKFMEKPPIALKLAKELVNESTDVDLNVGLAHEAKAFGILSSTEDFEEGVNAFLERRKPSYKGK